MATFLHVPDYPAEPSLRVAPLHLGKRLLRERTRLGIPIDDVALALQVDRHTVRSLEGGDAIPPRLSSRLRTYLQKLEAQPAPTGRTDSPLPCLSPVLGGGEDQGEGLRAIAAAAVTDDRNDTDPPAPVSPPLPTDHQPPTTMSFPAWVRAQRLGRGWTHRELAQRASVGHSTICNLERGRFTPSPVLRARIAAVLQSDASEPPPPLAPAPQPLAPVLDADSSATLRSRLIRGMLDRKLNQHEVAHQLGVNRTVIRNLIKDPRTLIPQDLAERITAWLGDQPPPAAAASPDPTAGITHPDILDNPASAAEDLADGPSLAPSPQPPVDDEPRLDPRLMRLFTNINLHLPRPSSRDVALLALLDKFPAYDAMTSAGEQSQWFRYFESLARLALVHRDGDA